LSENALQTTPQALHFAQKQRPAGFRAKIVSLVKAFISLGILPHCRQSWRLSGNLVTAINFN
jgi:hypothetical protein